VVTAVLEKLKIFSKSFRFVRNDLSIRMHPELYCTLTLKYDNWFSMGGRNFVALSSHLVWRHSQTQTHGQRLSIMQLVIIPGERQRKQDFCCKPIPGDNIDIASLHDGASSQKRSGVARVVKGSHSFTCTPRVNSRMSLPSQQSWSSFTHSVELEDGVDL